MLLLWRNMNCGTYELWPKCVFEKVFNGQNLCNCANGQF